MKIQAIQCPNCKASIDVGKSGKTPNGVFYCQYCGTAINIDDGIQRYEHTYKNIDVARILEAENEKKRIQEEQKEGRRQIVLFVLKRLPIIIAVIIFAFAYNNWAIEREKKKEAKAIEKEITNSRDNEIKKRALSIVTDNNMEIDSFSTSKDSLSISIETNTYQRSSVDSVEKELVTLFREYDFKSVSIKFEDDNRTVRYTDINEFGKVDRWNDKTNNLSDQDRESIIEEYTDAMKVLFEDYDEDYPVELEGIKCEDDKVVITVKTSTTYSEKLNDIDNDIVESSKTLSNQNLKIIYDTSIYGLLRTTTVSENGEITRKTDYSNKYTEEEQEDIIDEYREAISPICTEHSVNIKKMFLWDNSLRIYISNTTKEKTKVDSLQKHLLSAIGSCTPIVTKIEFCYDTLSTARKITISENQEVEVNIDFTK